MTEEQQRFIAIYKQIKHIKKTCRRLGITPDTVDRWRADCEFDAVMIEIIGANRRRPPNEGLKDKNKKRILACLVNGMMLSEALQHTGISERNYRRYRQDQGFARQATGLIRMNDQARQEHNQKIIKENKQKVFYIDTGWTPPNQELVQYPRWRE